MSPPLLVWMLRLPALEGIWYDGVVTSLIVNTTLVPSGMTAVAVVMVMKDVTVPRLSVYGAGRLFLQFAVPVTALGVVKVMVGLSGQVRCGSRLHLQYLQY